MSGQFWHRLTDEQRETLWRSVLARCAEITKGHRWGHSRSQGMWHGDGYGVTTIMDLSRPDGAHDVHVVSAHHRPAYSRDQTISVSVKRYSHNAEDFWEEQLSNRDHALVIGGHHYRVGEGGGRGFAGRRFVIRYKDTGREIVTNDLWYQGVIPPKFRDRLPDNAEFVEPEGFYFGVAS